MRKKILALVLIIFLSFGSMLTIQTDTAQAVLPFIVATSVANLVGTLLVSAGLTFATNGALQATVAQFMSSYGPAAAEITSMVSTIGVGQFVTISGTIANALNNFVNQVMPSAITNPTQTIAWQTPGITTSLSMTTQLFDVYNGSLTNPQYATLSVNPGTVVGDIVNTYLYKDGSPLSTGNIILRLGTDGTLSVWASNTSYSLVSGTDYYFDGTNYNVQVKFWNNGSTSVYFGSKLVYGVGFGTANWQYQVSLYPSVVSGTYTGGAVSSSDVLGANTTLDANQALKDLSGATVKIAENTTLLNKTASDISTQLASQTSILDDVRTGIRSLVDALSLTAPLDLTPLSVNADVLSTKFPFSFPWDLKSSLDVLNVTGDFQPFVVTFYNPLSTIFSGVDPHIAFTIDPKPLTDVLVPIVRAGFLLLFGVGLILITPKLFGGSS